jgi:hypothetical protein
MCWCAFNIKNTSNLKSYRLNIATFVKLRSFVFNVIVCFLIKEPQPVDLGLQ